MGFNSGFKGLRDCCGTVSLDTCLRQKQATLLLT